MKVTIYNKKANSIRSKRQTAFEFDTLSLSLKTERNGGTDGSKIKIKKQRRQNSVLKLKNNYDKTMLFVR
jgi:hypothetical protein